jgi:hypothetical protein
MSQLLDPDWDRASILPVGRNRKTGKLGMAVPQVAADLLSALMLPGDVYKGNVLMNDPATGHTSDEVIRRSADLAGAVTLGSGAIPAQANTLRSGMKIRNHKGEKIDAPRTFFRGINPGDKRRISTGAKEWDSHLFMASDIERARDYGSRITHFEAAPDARILYEGTAEWNKVAGKIRKDENLLQYADRAARAAKEAGYDAAWFKMQGNVGTAVFRPEKFKKIGQSGS